MASQTIPAVFRSPARGVGTDSGRGDPYFEQRGLCPPPNARWLCDSTQRYTNDTKGAEQVWHARAAVGIANK
jgi:hypothetical protein